MAKYRTALLCFIVLAFCPDVRCQTHCMLSSGKMLRYTPPTRYIFEITEFDVCGPIRITESPGGLLAYLEKVVDEVGKGYAFVDSEERSSYDPDRVVLRLHACDKTGADKYVMPIEQKYVHSYSHIRFLGESYVTLQFASRVVGLADESFINLKTGEILTLNQTVGPGDVGYSFSALSPDEEHYVVYWDGRTYLDGKMIFPFYDADPMRVSLSPEEYQSKKAQIQERLEGNGLPQRFRLFKDEIWSVDSRHFALINTDAEPRILVVDTEKVGPENEFIVKNVPVEMPREAFLNKNPYLKWDASGSTVIVTLGGDKDFSLEVPVTSSTPEK